MINTENCLRNVYVKKISYVANIFRVSGWGGGHDPQHSPSPSSSMVVTIPSANQAMAVNFILRLKISDRKKNGVLD
jgi:hypothetical protein